MEQRWRIELLGGLRARRGEEVISHFRTRKVAELLAYLAYYRQRSHPREVLIELLWPEADLDAGRHNLSMALTFLRRLFEPPGVPDGSVVAADRHSVRLNAPAITTDVAEFEAALRSAASAGPEQRGAFLAAAADLYGGELLPGHYEDWIFPEQQRLDELYFQTLRQLIAHLEGQGDLDGALQLALRAVAANRMREEAHREVMRLYGAGRQPDAALRHYNELERLMREEMDATPGPDTRALAASLRASEGRPPPQPLATARRSDPGGDDTRGRPRSPESDVSPAPRSAQLEPVGGAVPLGSSFYVVRPTDEEFHAAIARRDSIVLVKGPRQVGKTSLLARGLQQAREAGAQVVLTHFQTLSGADFDSSETLLLALAETLAEQVDLKVLPADVWDARRSPNLNFRRFMRREVLGSHAQRASTPLVWGLDEVDRLFSCSFGSEIFGLFRAWHDERALEPDGPWGNLTLAMAYSTEAHLFITDLNQSPFNVGTRLELSDFTLAQVADLNRRYGSPLRDEGELARHRELVGGHPYLVRRSLHEMAAHATPLSVLEARAGANEWIFGEHLRRVLVLMRREPDLCEAMRAVLQGGPCPTDERFYRLRGAGVLTGDSAGEAEPRCGLYAKFLAQHLA